MSKRLIINLLIIFASITAAVILSRTHFFALFLNSLDNYWLIGSLIGGFFYTSALTVGPAAAILAVIATNGSPLLTAILGGLGAVLGDFIIFSFIRRGINNGLVPKKFLISGFLIKVLPIFGFLIIASPLPDEIGLMLMGMSNISKQNFAMLSFLANSFGILLIGAAATLVN